MAKVKQPIKEEWDKIKKNQNASIELIQEDNDTGIVRSKGFKIKKRSKMSKLTIN